MGRRMRIMVYLLEALIILTGIKIARKFVTASAWCPLRKTLDGV